jgi:hypothetical protein
VRTAAALTSAMRTRPMAFSSASTGCGGETAAACDRVGHEEQVSHCRPLAIHCKTKLSGMNGERTAAARCGCGGRPGSRQQAAAAAAAAAAALCDRGPFLCRALAPVHGHIHPGPPATGTSSSDRVGESRGTQEPGLCRLREGARIGLYKNKAGQGGQCARTAATRSQCEAEPQKPAALRVWRHTPTARRRRGWCCCVMFLSAGRNAS